MKGIIFNVAAQVVIDAYGEETWDSLLDAAGVDGSYTSLGNYPDDELASIVAVAAESVGVSEADLLRQLGEGAIPLLIERYPNFFSPHHSTRAFLLTLNEIIHAEVRKLHPDAQTPEFRFDVSNPDQLLMHYSSPRRLCMLAEGFVQGTARTYGEVAHVEQIECMHRGDDHCIISCAFAPLAA